ncbi:MAG: ABC transporter ATP-binding protein [Candidatus Theseobacter exili]|nr:ABC transporter ATP-binding protein [Candidatus Theseobacter exili]
MKIIEAKSISKTYLCGIFSRKKVQALKSVSLNVNKGEIFGLLGPNGAGKTTFVKILLGIVKAGKGEASLFDVPVSSSASRIRVGYLSENHRYPSFMTAKSLLHFMGRLSGIEKSLRTQRIGKLLKDVGLADVLDMEVGKFSKGMLQRLGVAQALLSDPDLIVLDEPTGGVDPVGRKEIRDILLNLKSQGKTMFLNSHLLSEVEMICDRVAILNKGKLLKVGSVRDLTRHTQEYRIELRDPLNNYKEVLGSKAETLDSDNRCFRIHIGKIDELDKIIDELRKMKIGIDAVIPEKSSLEDMFIETLKGN